MSNLKVLIVEDEPFDGEVLGSLVSDLQIDYEVVTNGDDVINMLNDMTDVGILFLDLDLPGANGYEVFEAIRADSRYQHLPIVAYSSHSNEMNTAYQMGFNGFLAKPVDSNMFAENLGRLLNGDSVWE